MNGKYQIQAKYKNRWISWVEAHDYAAAVSAVNKRFAQYNHKVAFRAVAPDGTIISRLAAH